MCPLSEDPRGKWGKARSSVPMDCWVCPVAAPNVTFGDVRSMLTTGSYVAKKMSVVPELTMPVDFFGSTRCWRVWLAGTLLIGKVKVDMSRVGLKLAVRVKILSIVYLLRSALLTVPP